MNPTLSLGEELDAKLTAAAEREGVSREEFVVRAVAERVERLTRADLIRARAAEIVEEDRNLLDRLAQ